MAQDQIGSLAVIVDPIDEEAEMFYEKIGYTKIPDGGKMFMTIKKIGAGFDTNSRSFDELWYNGGESCDYAKIHVFDGAGL